MVTSMTGFGRGEASQANISVVAEVRSVNSRFLEISTGIPKRLNYRENDMRDMIKSKVARGKISVALTIENTNEVSGGLVNLEIARQYHDSLQEVRKQLKIKETVKFEHLLQYPELFKPAETNGEASDEEWTIIANAIDSALEALNTMRKKEGRELSRDLLKRIKSIEINVGKIEKMTIDRVPQERQRLRERIGKLFESDEIDEQRLEMEIVILADKLDISEECVRIRSHIKFFNEALKSKDQAGRKINFLLQEMNREINTMGAKANDAEISHLVVAVKEDLEKIREQVQNIE